MPSVASRSTRESRPTDVERGMPKLPPRNSKGNYPAVETMIVTMAREFIRRRRAVGLSQLDLAKLAGVRPNTIVRMEDGKYSASLATIKKVDAALKRAETKARH